MLPEAALAVVDIAATVPASPYLPAGCNRSAGAFAIYPRRCSSRPLPYGVSLLRSREADFGDADHAAVDHADDCQAVATAADLLPLPLVRKAAVDDQHRVVARIAAPDDDDVAVALGVVVASWVLWILHKARHAAASAHNERKPLASRRSDGVPGASDDKGLCERPPLAKAEGMSFESASRSHANDDDNSERYGEVVEQHRRSIEGARTPNDATRQPSCEARAPALRARRRLPERHHCVVEEAMQLLRIEWRQCVEKMGGANTGMPCLSGATGPDPSKRATPLH